MQEPYINYAAKGTTSAVLQKIICRDDLALEIFVGILELPQFKYIQSFMY